MIASGPAYPDSSTSVQTMHIYCGDFAKKRCIPCTAKCDGLIFAGPTGINVNDVAVALLRPEPL